MMFRKLKVGQLATILVNRNAINNEEYFSLVLMDDLLKFPKEKWDYILNNKLSFGIDYIKRALVKMLYQPGFVDKIEFDYYNNILPYVEKHSLISLWLTK